MRHASTRTGLVAAVVFAVLLSGCEDILTVSNLNTPDRERALAESDDVEALIGSTFHTWWSHTHSLHPMIGFSAAADELTSSRPAFLMRMMGTQPRYEGGGQYPNDPSFAGRGHVERPWFGLYSAISSVRDGLVAIEDGIEIGPDGGDTPRARAFGKFVQGLSHGMIALMFDQGFVVTEATDPTAGIPDLLPYGAVMDSALAMLDESITIAESNAFTLPDDWINGVPVDDARLVRLARSYKARFMAEVARTPEERAAVDWAAVRDLIDQGIVEDFAPVGDGRGGAGWFDAMMAWGQREVLNRADYLTIGPADTSGAYQAWLDQPVQERHPFRIETADRRITGDTPEDPGTDFRYVGPVKMPGGWGPYLYSFYHHYRYIGFLQGGRTGPMPEMTMPEMDLLKAEALLRLGGSTADIAALINETRVGRGELPPATPDDPTGTWDDGQNASSSASLWAKLKHEKRIETYGTAVGLAYFDDRGWNDLVRGTHLHLPIPAKELETLQMEIYSFGGQGTEGASSSDIW